MNDVPQYLSSSPPAALDQQRQAEAAFARQVLEAEAAAVRGIPLDETFNRAVELILRATGEAPRPEGRSHAGGGSVVVTGLGKSGLISQKISATFASTGTPSQYLHPVEAVHGDLGRIRANDVVLALSFGGGTEEVVALAAMLQQDGVPIIAVTGSPQSDLGRLATVNVSIGNVTEACPHNLAPTASTTAMLALGDALALCVSRRKNFGVDDFRKFHPGGGLGRQLMPVIQAIRFRPGENLPLVPRDLTVEQAYALAEEHAQQSGLRRPGALLIVDEQGKLAGILTDGDLRSALIRRGPGAWSSPIDTLMTRRPTTLPDTALVRDAVRVVREHRFDEIPIVDAENCPVGLIDVQDLAALRVIEG